MSSDIQVPWKQIGPPRNPRDVQTLDSLLKKTDVQLAKPDAWLSSDGREISYTKRRNWFPLSPGAAMLKCRTILHQFHPEVYIGRGMSLGVSYTPFSAGAVRVDMVQNGSQWHVDASTKTQMRANPREVLKRARAALGQFDYSLLGTNCQHVAQWIMTGEARSSGIKATRPLVTVMVVLLLLVILFVVLVIMAVKKSMGRVRL